MQKVLIFGNSFRINRLPQMQQLFTQLKKHHLDIAVDKQFSEFLAEEVGIDRCLFQTIDNDDFTGDIAFSLGGDGTFLNTAARIGSKGIPIIGINTGHLGFLADITNDEAATFVDDIAMGNFKVEQRTLLEARTKEGGEELNFPFALNELAILKQDLSSMISVEARVDGELLNTYKADGLLVATPTGSTAYAMSAGGPITTPNTPVFVIAPIAPHSLTMRPIVLPDDCTIELTTESRSQSYLAAFDGRSQVLDCKTTLLLRRADYKINIIRPNEHTFFNTLKTKLMWGADKR
ncbi:MAG: NAD kinase [Paludibacteraceae bacterium]|nr:NAD kinase [Paludibacteraceae bacterium]